jgi:hypothetical protein
MGSTSDFLRLMNEANDRIAAREAEESAPKFGEDPVRLQRDRERREKLGQLRAREHPGKRPMRVRSVFGYVKMYPRM